MSVDDSIPTYSYTCSPESSRRSRGSFFEMSLCNSPMLHAASISSEKQTQTPSTVISTPSRTTTKTPVCKEVVRCLHDTSLNTPTSATCIPIYNLHSSGLGRSSKDRDERRTNRIWKRYVDEEAQGYDGDIYESGGEDKCGPGPASSTSTAWMSTSWGSIKSDDHCSGSSSLIRTPPRTTQAIDSSMYSFERGGDVSPLSLEGTALMNSSLSSSETIPTIPGYEYKSFQLCSAPNRRIHDHHFEGMNATASDVYRRKPMETVEACHFEPEVHSKESKYHHSPPVVQNLAYYSKDRMMNQSKLRGIAKKLLLFIIFYSSSVFLVFLVRLNSIDLNALFYEELRSQSTKEINGRSQLSSLSFPHHESSYSEELLRDADGAITIRRSLGGLHPFHDIHENHKREKLKRDYNSEVEIGMYDQSSTVIAEGNTSRPRIFHFSAGGLSSKRPKKRRLDFVPTPFSDNTQLYGILSSDDSALSKMEPLRTDDEGDCVVEPWQNEYFPSCNNMHELDLLHVDDMNNGGHLKLFEKQGYWRNAWQVDLPFRNSTAELESVILKTPKYEHNFEHAHYEHDRIDALAMSRLTFSPHVVDIYSFCGRSVLTEFAGGPRLGSVFDKARRHNLKRLEIARNLALGLSHVHYGKDGDEAQLVHFDINPANVVVIDKNTLRINDFNIAKTIKRNATSGDQCGVPSHHYPNAQWRSPEEVNEHDNLSVKVDVFSLGHILYRIIVGHEPWNKMENGGRRPSSQELTRKVGAGILPRVPRQVLDSKEPEIVVIRKAMFMCYTVDVIKRPTSKAIAKFLDDELSRLGNDKM